MRTRGGRLTTTLLVTVLVVTAGCAGFGGSTGAPTETTATDEVTDTQAEDSTAGGGTTENGGSTDGTPTDTSVPTDGATGEIDESSFTYRILDIATINDTAREVTVRLTNDQNRSAQNVVVDTVMYAGNTTADDQEVWSGSEDLGALSAGESTEFSQTVSLGLNDALKVRGADGWVTIVTTIQTDNGTVTITQRRNVS